MSVIKWQDPSADDSNLENELKSKPGQWALVKERVSPLLSAFDPELSKLTNDKHFEVEFRRTEGMAFNTVGNIYARYTG